MMRIHTHTYAELEIDCKSPCRKILYSISSLKKEDGITHITYKRVSPLPNNNYLLKVGMSYLLKEYPKVGRVCTYTHFGLSLSDTSYDAYSYNGDDSWTEYKKEVCTSIYIYRRLSTNNEKLYRLEKCKLFKEIGDICHDKT